MDINVIKKDRCYILFTNSVLRHCHLILTIIFKMCGRAQQSLNLLHSIDKKNTGCQKPASGQSIVIIIYDSMKLGYLNLISNKLKNIFFSFKFILYRYLLLYLIFIIWQYNFFFAQFSKIFKKINNNYYWYKILW